jgi:hypothetical protein
MGLDLGTGYVYVPTDKFLHISSGLIGSYDFYFCSAVVLDHGNGSYFFHAFPEEVGSALNVLFSFSKKVKRGKNLTVHINAGSEDYLEDGLVFCEENDLEIGDFNFDCAPRYAPNDSRNLPRETVWDSDNKMFIVRNYFRNIKI